MDESQDDVNDEMASIMGFSTFNHMKKPNSKRQKLQPFESIPNSDTKNSNLIPLGERKPTMTISHNQPDSLSPQNILQKSLNDLTVQDLQLLKRGIKQSDGRTVYFSTSFVIDPWKEAQ